MSLAWSRGVAVAAVWILLSLGAAAQSDSSPIERLIDLSGIRVQMTESLAQYRGSVVDIASVAGASPESLEALGALLDEVLAPSRFLDAVRQEAESALAPDDVAQLLSWYESDLGARLTAAEERASALPPSEFEALALSGELIPDSERRAIYERIDELTNATGQGVAIAKHLALMHTVVLWSLDYPGERPPLSAFYLGIAAQEAELRASIELALMLTHTFTYREFTLAELEEYAAFNATPSSQRFGEATMKAVEEEFRRAVNLFAERAPGVVRR